VSPKNNLEYQTQPQTLDAAAAAAAMPGQAALCTSLHMFNLHPSINLVLHNDTIKTPW
jgi:hypothetical protein